MTSSQPKRTLSTAYRNIPDPGGSHIRHLQTQRTAAHKAVDTLQITGDAKQYISTNTNPLYLTAAESFFVPESQRLSITSVEHYVRRATSVLSDRVSALWSIRESNSHTKMPVLNAKYIAVGVMCSELRSILSLLQRLHAAVSSALKSGVVDTASSSKPVYSQHQLTALLHLLNHSVGLVVPSLQARLDNFVVQLVRDTTTESMRQYCTAHPRDFLVLQRTHSVVLHTLYNILGVQSTHVKRKVQSEVVLFSLLRDHSIHPVYTSIALTCDTLRTQHYTSLALNATLKHFLRYLLVHEERFDEPGVYQLFRTILKLQEYIGDLKKELNMGASEKLVQDNSVWRRAECIVQLLNSEVFAVVSTSAKPSHKSVRNSTALNSTEPNLNPNASSSNTTTSILSGREEAAWRKLVGVQKRSHSLRRQRHKGTVFFSIDLVLNNL